MWGPTPRVGCAGIVVAGAPGGLLPFTDYFCRERWFTFVTGLLWLVVRRSVDGSCRRKAGALPGGRASSGGLWDACGLDARVGRRKAAGLGMRHTAKAGTGRRVARAYVRKERVAAHGEVVRVVQTMA